MISMAKAAVGISILYRNNHSTNVKTLCWPHM